MKYTYPQINRNIGYAWNMLQRCLNEVGIEPISTGDSGGVTFLQFSRELTPEEKTKLDVLMADNPTLPPNPKGSMFVIRDVWNQKNLIEGAMGFPYKVYYTESVPGSGNVDQVELHFESSLTTQQRNKIIAEYGKLITLK
jgi:hypothetical protein